MSEAVAVAPPAQAARPMSAADALDVDAAGGRGADVPGGTAATGTSEPDSAGLSLAGLAASAGSVALLLFTLQQALRLPSGYGIEDFLGWRNADSLVAALVVWCPAMFGWHAAATYVLVDTGLFIALYAVLIAVAVKRLSSVLAAGQSHAATWLRRLLRPATGWLLAALILTDTLENLGGALRLGIGPPAYLLGFIAMPLFAMSLWLLCTPRAAGTRRLQWLGVGLAVALVVLAQSLASLGVGGTGCSAGFKPATSLATAHDIKLYLFAAALAPGLIAATVWWFGGEFDPNRQAAERVRRAALRSGAGGVIGRSRYVLFVLAVFGALTLALDQCRDLLLAIADVRSIDAGFWAWRLPVLLLGAISAGLFAHSCWMWTRLAGMIVRPGLTLDRDSPEATSIGKFARAWARALSVLPLVMVCILVAYALGDSVLAARHADLLMQPQAPQKTSQFALVGRTLLLTLFALGSVAMGVLLVKLRQHLRLAHPADYYNSESDLYGLLWNTSAVQTGRRAHELPGWARTLSACTRPAVLPVLALIVMALVRSVMFWHPDTTALAPPGLVLATLALTWWLGVLGLLSLFEQQRAAPWILLPLIVAGVLAATQWVDNHVLPWPAAGTPDLAQLGGLLQQLRQTGSIALWALALFGALAWCATTWPAADLGATIARWPGGWRVGLRWGVAGAGFLLVIVLLHRLDRSADVIEATRTADPKAAPVVAAALRPPEPAASDAVAAWQRQLPAPSGTTDRVFIVSAEGGGIRSAYWTAQVLLRLHTKEPYFSQRSFLLSGVSGGSVGHAVFRACLRQTGADAALADGLPGAQTTEQLDACIEQGFNRLDALSPLLGGLLFEDVFARVIPLPTDSWLPRCKLPGCGHLNRAFLFEREWMRAFPALAEPLAPARPGEPHLALNSTWVETGNRALASSLRVDSTAFPAAVSVRHCLGAEPSLITAAHTSARFPFTNPLAAIVAKGGPDKSCPSSGHLIDGGYFDNSGATTLIDAARLLEPALKGSPWRLHAVLIRNGQKSALCAAAPASGPPAACIVPPERVRSDAAELDAPTDRRRLDLYADLLGPAVALLNVSGVGAHGRSASAGLRGALGDRGVACERARIVLFDQIDDGSLVPLGWYLSRPAREALAAQALVAANAKCP